MALLDRNRIYDVFSSLISGVDGGRLPHLIEKDRIAEGDNIALREGLPIQRPPYRSIALTFINPNVTYNADGSFQTADGTVGASRDGFEDGILQEASYYAPYEGREYIMASVGGRLFRFEPVDEGEEAEVFEVVLARRNRSTIPINYHLQAGVYHITQDGENAPIIFDGMLARRAGVDEIFTGLMMGYGYGRIVLIGTHGEIFFGDLRDSKNGGDADLLGFTETQFINEGFPTALPSGMGFPTAIVFPPQQDTATGQGECVIFGQGGAESFFVSIPRDQWKNSQFQRTALTGIGNAGHRSTAIVNQDIWFRDPKAGWRSYRQARAQQNLWSQVPLSTEVRKWIESDTPRLLKHCSAISFANRLIVTSTPYPNETQVYHNGLLSLDFDVISSAGQSSNPAWDGHWSNYAANPLAGVKCTRLVEGIFKGRQRAFMFYLTPEGKNALREISSVTTGRDTEGPITARLITRSMDFETPFLEKKLYGGDFWAGEISEPTQFTFTYRPDQLPDFSPWQSITLQPVPGTVEESPGFVPTVRDGFAPRRRLKKPPDIGDPKNTKRIVRRGYEYQAKIEWTGRARLRKFRLHAQQEVEDSKAYIPTP